jgi:ABC-type sugar transport system ATPase subunit
MEVLLRVEGISKSFGSVIALNDVSFEIYQNEVVGLVGDNGAGKSTLFKILSGNFPPDRGSIYLDGTKVNFKSSIDAKKMGIETVYQDLSLCSNLDSTSNLFIGREITKNFGGLKILQKREMENKAAEVMKKIGINMPSLKERVEFLSGGQRQAVALGRFVAWSQNLALLDEPMAALGVRETRKVLELILQIKKEKELSIIMVSHNLQHVFEVADRIIVLRHGNIVGIRNKSSTDPEEIVGLITGAISIKK